ncbi:MAG: hypothetical protein HC875_40615 [Anaerolineales bacterium]|nr:hypothetical protein [Anaerolineales bacterium]
MTKMPFPASHQPVSLNSALHNPHLPGDAFFWAGGPVGVLLSHGWTATTAEVRLLARHLHEKATPSPGRCYPAMELRPKRWTGPSGRSGRKR